MPLTKNGKRQTYKGFFKPTNPQKYRGDINSIVWRSSWELKVMNALDQNPSVVEWASEEIAIPYISPVDDKIHRYFPDFYVCTLNSNGKKHKTLIEVKPAKETSRPKTPKRITPSFIREAQTWSINEAKWAAAEKFCGDVGWTFRILTEKELFPKF